MNHAAFQRVAAGFRARIVDGEDLAVGGGIVGGEEMVSVFADDFPLAYDDRIEGAAVPGTHAVSRELEGAPHEFLFHGNFVYFLSIADKDAGTLPAVACAKAVRKGNYSGLSQVQQPD